MEISRWQQELRDVIRDHGELLKAVALNTETRPSPQTALAGFPVKVPVSYLKRIRQGHPDDPLLRQVLPMLEEETVSPRFNTDPVGELNKASAPGLIQKYHGRVLLVTTSVCAIHCRYCFRRHYPYSDNNPARENWTAALDVIRSDHTIKEVILSGGDPLSLADEKLESLIRQLEDIPQLGLLRIHTRMPVVMPGRVTDKLIDVIKTNRFKQTVVIHANHPDEINEEVRLALQALHNSGIQLLNQSVLLRGVNDDALILGELSERLYASHVLPYYLHMLDPVAGAAHFEVEDSIAKTIMEQLRTTLPGYLVPRLVRETEGAPYKLGVE